MKLLSKEKFLAYEAVRQGGKTNMFDTMQVEELAREDEGVLLSRQDILDIMGSYEAYLKEYLPENLQTRDEENQVETG